MNILSAAILAANAGAVGLASLGENAILERRPYLATEGPNRGHSVIAVNTGQFNEKGEPVRMERRIAANAGTLRKDEWINLEDRLYAAARERLVVVADLQAAGLTYNTGGLGSTISEWETGSEVTDANVSMDGESNKTKDKQEFGLRGVPVPIVHKEFTIGQRMLEASRMRGAALDVTTGEEAARAVARASESLVIRGSAIKEGGYNIYGMLNHPDRATKTISNWANNAVSCETVLAEILDMVANLETDERYFGPYTLYIPAAFSAKFRQDFKANSDKTLRDRVLEVDVIRDIKVADQMPAGNVVLVQLTSDVIDLAVGSDFTTVQWASGSGWTNHFQVFAAWAPRIKSDYDGRCGVCHGATA